MLARQVGGGGGRGRGCGGNGTGFGADEADGTAALVLALGVLGGPLGGGTCGGATLAVADVRVASDCGVADGAIWAWCCLSSHAVTAVAIATAAKKVAREALTTRSRP